MTGAPAPRLRDARPGDLPAIRDLQVASWRDAYRGLLPQAFLGDAVARVLAARWAGMPGPDWLVGTAWVGDRLAGFVAVDRAHADGAFVDNLHVAAWAQGRGVGRRLMARAAARLHREGVPRLWLTVICANRGARAFYRRLGGAEGAARDTRLQGHPVRVVPVCWHDLAALAGGAGGGANS